MTCVLNATHIELNGNGTVHEVAIKEDHMLLCKFYKILHQCKFLMYSLLCTITVL